MGEDRPLKGCLHAQGKSDLNQTAYILSKSLLHLGADSFPAHVASGYGKKIVCLYSNNYAANCDPYWTADEDKVLLEPKRDGKKPSFAAEESPKTINTINPEDIADGVLKLLNIKNNKNQNKTNNRFHNIPKDKNENDTNNNKINISCDKKTPTDTHIGIITSRTFMLNKITTMVLTPCEIPRILPPTKTVNSSALISAINTAITTIGTTVLKSVS